MEAGLLRAQAKESVVCKGVLGTFAPDRPPVGHPWPGTYGPAKNMLPRRLHAYRSIVLLLFLQKQNLATAIYLFGLGDDDPFIVLTETKFSFRCIPVGIGTLLTGLGSKKNTCDKVLTMTSTVPW